MIQVMAENADKRILLASSIRVVRVPKWCEFSGVVLLESALANIPEFALYVPDSWMKAKNPMPPDRDYLVAVMGTLAEMWLKKSVTTATLMR